MILDPDSIHYACVAAGPTLLAEFNSSDAALGDVAARCLDRAPRHHAEFSHTVRSRTYAFLIDEGPLVYFAIFDEKLDNSEGLAFMRKVRAAFGEVFEAGQRRLEKLTSHCFQGEFSPVFRQLIGPGPYQVEGGLGSPTRSVSFRPKPDKVVTKKMKNLLLVGKMNDENGGRGIGLSREFLRKTGGLGCGPLQTGRKEVWKKHVWIVLSLDLIICVMLFCVWLWVCNGLQCMES